MSEILSDVPRMFSGFVLGAVGASIVVVVALYFWTRRVTVEPHERAGKFYLIGKGGEDE